MEPVTITKSAVKALQPPKKNGKTGNALDTFIDSVLIFLVNLLIPVDAIADAIRDTVIANKWLILGMCGLLVLLCCMALFSVLFGSSRSQALANDYQGLPAYLQGYIETGFQNNADPVFSPFGGVIGENTRVTAFFHDLDYYRSFGHWHEGIDLVPNSNYYNNNTAYKLYGDVVIFATCSGTAKSLQDSSGANYIYLICNDGVYTVLMVHNKYNFIPWGSSAKVVAGQPLAVMGMTGNATGPHVHYVIKDLRTGDYVDPLNLINNSN